MGKKSIFFISATILLGMACTASFARPSTTSDIVVGSQVIAKRKMDALLKDPDSAEYKNVHAYDDHVGGRETIVFCGEVNAKNGFGGYMGYQRFVSTVVLAATENEMQDMDNLWGQLCKSENDLGQVAF